MTLSEVDDLFGHWQEHPPAGTLLHLVARLLGWKPERKVEMIEGVDYQTIAAKTEHLFHNPARFFSERVPVARPKPSARK